VAIGPVLNTHSSGSPVTSSMARAHRRSAMRDSGVSLIGRRSNSSRPHRGSVAAIERRAEPTPHHKETMEKCEDVRCSCRGHDRSRRRNRNRVRDAWNAARNAAGR